MGFHCVPAELLRVRDFLVRLARRDHLQHFTRARGQQVDRIADVLGLETMYPTGSASIAWYLISRRNYTAATRSIPQIPDTRGAQWHPLHTVWRLCLAFHTARSAAWADGVSDLTPPHAHQGLTWGLCTAPQYPHGKRGHPRVRSHLGPEEALGMVDPPVPRCPDQQVHTRGLLLHKQIIDVGLTFPDAGKVRLRTARLPSTTGSRARPAGSAGPIAGAPG
jgi:hypothetical protein